MSGKLPGPSDMQGEADLPLCARAEVRSTSKKTPELGKTTSVELGGGSGTLEVAREELGKALGSSLDRSRGECGGWERVEGVSSLLQMAGDVLGSVQEFGFVRQVALGARNGWHSEGV